MCTDDKSSLSLAIDCIASVSVQIRLPFWIFKIRNFWRSTISDFKIWVFEWCKFHYSPNLLQRTKFHQNRIMFHWNMAIWWSSRWRSSDIFKFQSLKFKLNDRDCCRILCRRTNFWENQTIRSRVMASDRHQKCKSIESWTQDFHHFPRLLQYKNLIEIGWNFIELWRYSKSFAILNFRSLKFFYTRPSSLSDFASS